MNVIEIYLFTNVTNLIFKLYTYIYIYMYKVFGGCFYNLLGMTGVIPVTYRNVTYNIPIGVWVMFDYPLTPPEFVVMPTESMKIVVGKHVKPDGIITHPYLDTYSSKPQVIINFIYIFNFIIIS